jgi:2C-methyl-D-erythritol 2,4-cyclodiphosphate synthase
MFQNGFVTATYKTLCFPNLTQGNIDVTVLCGEQSRTKKRVPEMQRNIAEGLGVEIDQVHVKVSSMDGHDASIDPR